MIKKLRSKYSFQWRKGNRFQLHIDGEEIFAAMLASIQGAKSHVMLEMYLVESGSLMDRFIEALLDAARRQVNIYLLFDDYGARGLRESDREQLQSVGIDCEFYNKLRYGRLRSNLLRDHRKLLLVDGAVVFVGGIGITDEFLVESAPLTSWHDIAVSAEGPVVADWAEVFRANWKYCAGEELPVSGLDAQLVHDSNTLGRVACGYRFSASEIQRAFIRQALNARQRVWIMTAYFVPSLRLRRVLRAAARRGVDVRLLLPGPITDHPAVRFAGRRFYASLLMAGVRIFEYQPRFLHGKILLCDDWVSLGSSNLDRWNLRWNLEGNQEVNDAGFAAQVRTVFEQDIAQSEECRFADWQHRARLFRLQEWFWGRIDALQETMGRWLRR